MPMRIVLEFQSEQLDFEVPEDRLVVAWNGPKSVAPERVGPLIREVLENPRGYPPLRQAVVPGDRVVVALDPATPQLSAILPAVCEVLNGAGVTNETIHLLLTSPPPADWSETSPAGLAWTVHDPDDSASLAYLASNPQGRRIYLNRLATDADFVLAIGPFGFDATLGARGPWSVIFPGLSDTETRRSFRPQARNDPGKAEPLSESANVSWLLGSQFQIGVLPGASGLAGIVAGIEESVQEEGLRALDSSWTLRSDRRADLVVVGVGQPDQPAGFDALADALATATRLIRPGGKVAVLSRVGGTPGPAVGRLLGIEDPRSRQAALKGAENEPDFSTARKLARSLALADVYLFSNLAEDVVEDLAMIALGRPAEAHRLANIADSCLFISHAEMTRAEVAETDD